MKFTFNYFEICKSTDKQAHYYLSEAKRNNIHTVEINNKHYGLVITEMCYRAKGVGFKSVGNGIYVFK